MVESRKYPAVKILRQIPFIGSLRAGELVALIETPHRFRSKRQLWTYSGQAVVAAPKSQRPILSIYRVIVHIYRPALCA
ncbi:MAG TPA: transposase [Terracidiphilus sp.]|nr:transposase [Terracidiphilus sp.]